MEPRAGHPARIRLLGPVEVAGGGAGPGGPKQRLLLAVLALRAGEVVPVDVLVDVLWFGRRPDDPQRSLQVHVSKLRSVLAAAGIEGAIEHRSGGYVLRAEDDLTDVRCFERLVADGTAIAGRDPQRVCELLDAALALWRGRPLGGATDHPALRGDLARLEELHLWALETRADARLATGDHLAVATELHELTELHPLRERLWGQLMLALYRAGRPGDALAAYERARSHLAQELGADPSRGLRDLHAAILRHDPALGSGATAVPAPDGAGRSVPDARTVAVLPFDVIGGDEEVTYLAAGLHSDLLAELSRASGLEVISRTSLVAYADASAPAPRIARELRAGTIVHGTLQSAGERFRLTVHVVDGPRDRHRWARSYDAELTTDRLFAVQTQLARDIAGAVSAELAPPATPGGEPARTDSLEAYRLTAAGRHHADQRTGDGLRRAIACFEEAARLDPDYADAWIGLADALVALEAYGHGERHELLPRAERAVHRALALAPDSATARTSLGVLHVGYQDAPAALSDFRRAIATGPGYADAHNWHSWVSLIVGDAASGLDHARRTVELDPRSAEAHGHLALAYAATGQPEEGAAAARQARRLSPYATADLYDALCCFEAGRHEDARRLLEPLTGGGLGVRWADHGPDALLVVVLEALGDRAAARAVAAAVDPFAFPFAAGLMQLALGELGTAERTLHQVDRLTAWPCLLIHNHLRAVWERAGELHSELQRVAWRSWSVELPSLAA